MDIALIKEKAFELFKKGKSLLILGPGGTGKSLLIKKMEEYINDRPDLDSFINIHVCATTGVAAYNIGGMTINSFMGIGTGEKDVNYLISKIIRNKNLVDRLLSIGYNNIVVIDKHESNLNILSEVQPSVKCVLADVSKIGPWTVNLILTSPCSQYLGEASCQLGPGRTCQYGDNSYSRHGR